MACGEAVHGDGFGAGPGCARAKFAEHARHALDEALPRVSEGGAAWRALRFVQVCLETGRPVTDTEALFLVEDLKRAGIDRACLAEVRDAMRRDNAAVGRAIRDGGLQSVSMRGRAERGAVAEAPRIRAGKASLVKWGSPLEELDGLARYAQDTVRRCGEKSPALDVWVAVPNERWGHLAQRALERRGFAVNRTQLGYALAEDPRGVERAPASRALNALALLARPDDALAWRVWCGLGKADLGAQDWAALLTAWDGAGEFDVAEVASLAKSSGFLLGAMTERLEQGRQMLAELSALRGYSLLQAIQAGGADCLPGLVQRADVEDGPGLLFDKAQRLLCGPVFDSAQDAVQVATYEALPDVAPAEGYGLVVAMGAVEGLESPSCLGEPSGLGRVLGLECDELVISYFSSMPSATAQKVGAVTRRRRVVDGVEMAHTMPSRILDSFGPSLPPTQDGQAFLTL